MLRKFSLSQLNKAEQVETVVINPANLPAHKTITDAERIASHLVLFHKLDNDLERLQCRINQIDALIATLKNRIRTIDRQMQFFQEEFRYLNMSEQWVRELFLASKDLIEEKGGLYAQISMLIKEKKQLRSEINYINIRKAAVLEKWPKSNAEATACTNDIDDLGQKRLSPHD